MNLFAYHCQKHGNSENEYEDAYWFTLAPFRCAVADGATESVFASLWANMLAKRFGRCQVTAIQGFRDCVEELGCKWNLSVKNIPLPWYAEEKVKMGAFSTLTRLMLLDDGNWEAIAVGDSCLFHVRGNELIESLPCCKSEEFGNSPLLLSTNKKRNVGIWDKVTMQNGSWEEGDTFFLMTDAIAHWFLKQNEASKRPCDTLLTFTKHEKGIKECFMQWTSEKRECGEMKNDDVTLIIIRT